MKTLRDLLFIAVVGTFGYYTYKIQIVNDALTPVDICLVVTCFVIALVAGMYRQKQKIELIRVKIDSENVNNLLPR
jgi:uncharacterized membrane protein YpjA